MHPELEALLKAFDAAKQTPGEEGKHLRALYEARLEALREQHPNISRATLERLVQVAYARWLKAQDKPSTLPPGA